LEKGAIDRGRILQHELIHVRQWHSIDIIILEILKIVNWFNPVVSLLQSKVKLVHEFIADDKIVDDELERESYSIFLMEHAVIVKPSSICSTIFGESMLKRRILMMHQEKTDIREKYKYSILLLIAPLMIFCSSCLYSKSNDIARDATGDKIGIQVVPGRKVVQGFEITIKYSKEDSDRIRNWKKGEVIRVNMILDSARRRLGPYRIGTNVP
jgi:hypothetical protein